MSYSAAVRKVYSHRISWVEKHKEYGTVTKSFNTVKNAVDQHLKFIKANPDVLEVKVTAII